MLSDGLTEKVRGLVETATFTSLDGLPRGRPGLRFQYFEHRVGGMAVDAFGIEKEFLQDLLVEASSGRSKLPEFQRGWVWPMENIRSLLASISLGYPVGTIMMLRTGGDVRFKERPIEGASPKSSTSADRLILDGQQRMTSLFQALLLNRPIEV